MTLAALGASALLVVIGLIRVDARPVKRGMMFRPVKRGMMFWWVWSAFGLPLASTALQAAGVVSITNKAIGFAFTVPMLGIGLLLAIRAGLRDGKVSMGALACTAPIVLSLSYVLGGGSTAIPIQAIASMLVAVVIPVGGYDPDEIAAGLVSSLRSLAVLMLVLAAVGVPGLIGQCRPDKCSLWGEQIGQAGNANGLGMAVAFVGVVVAVRLSWWRVVIVFVGVALLTDLCSSRSALFPLAFGLAAILVERLARRTALNLLRAPALGTAIGTIVVIGLWPWSPVSFTDRAGLWRQALSLTSERPWFGWGPSFWVRQPHTTTLDANYSAHNMLLEVLVSFGIVGLLMIVAGVFLVRRTLHPGASALWHTATLCLLGGGVMEVIAAPGRFYLVPGAFILLLVLDTGAHAEQTLCSRLDVLRSGKPTDG